MWAEGEATPKARRYGGRIALPHTIQRASGRRTVEMPECSGAPESSLVNVCLPCWVQALLLNAHASVLALTGES